jgi:serine/threonine protein kinase
MPVQVVCPKCKKAMPFDGAAAKVSCPACGASFRVAPSGSGEAKRPTVGPAADSKADSPPAGMKTPGDRPRMVGTYEVVRELGRGAFGVVYLARDPALARDVAIKLLNRDALSSAKAVERFRREARVVAQMHHNGIVPVYQLGEQDGAQFIVSRFIPGKALSEVIPEDGMEPGRAVDLTIQLLEALAYAHNLDVLHRDVKPANAILDEKGQLYLMDFGLAGWVGQETGRMTQDGSVMGTPSYMAPEQAKGDVRRVGPAADQYSAGVVLYELLTGHLPFEGGPIQAIIYNVINTQAPPLSEWRKDIDTRLESICLTALAKQPEHRHPNCRDFADALRDWRGESGQPALASVSSAEAAPKPKVAAKTIPPGAKLTAKNLPPVPAPVLPPPPPKRPAKKPAPARQRSRLGCLLGVVFLALLILAGVGYLVVGLLPPPTPGGKSGAARPGAEPTRRAPGLNDLKESTAR